MKSTLKKYIFLSLAGTLVATSCTNKFDEMNVDPNNPTAIGPQYLLPYALEKSVDRYWGGNIRFERLNIDGAMLWIQYFTRNIYSNEGDNYGVSPAFYNNNWNSFFNDGLLNYNRIIIDSAPTGKAPNASYEGIGLVMRAWLFATVTDLWGAVPYSEALKGTAETPNYIPAYDSQEKVYEGVLADLKLANDKIVVGGPAVQGDILYGGDLLKWKKFANSLRLRLANRQAAKKPTESRAIMKEILGDATKYPIFTSNADNAVIKNTATIPSNNEWHEVMIRGGRTDWNISSTLADKLNGLKDTRITIFANANKDGKYIGHPNGLPDAIATTYLASSSTIGNYFVKADSPSVIMTYAEVNLILAEAVLDGDVTGDAKTYFEKGVNASFEQFGLKAPTDYFTTVGTITREKVLDQKWIALFGQGLEAWAEYRRTGFPVMPVKDPRAVFENDGVLPTRLPYPSTEYSLNKASLDKGIALNGGPDNMKTKLWWAEK